MKKKLYAFLAMTAAMLFGSALCQASIIPPQGYGQIGLSSVVLCDSLSLRSAPSFDSSVVKTLRYGDRIIAMETADGWAHCVTGDSEDSPSGYVNEDFILIDPSWYRTEGDTVVYAWNDTSAPKVALLDAGTTLPILRDDGDWLIVSLRGATGWINNPVRTPASGSAAAGSTAASSTAAASGSEVQSTGGVITVYDEYGDGYTLYEGTDGYWRDRSGTAYDRLSDTEFQVHEGNKRVHVYYPSQDYDDDGIDDEESGDTAFTVYARDGSTALVHPTGGAMYEDGSGRTYVKDDQDGYFYCITTDITYAMDPTMWTGEAYGENEFPVDED